MAFILEWATWNHIQLPPLKTSTEYSSEHQPERTHAHRTCIGRLILQHVLLDTPTLDSSHGITSSVSWAIGFLQEAEHFQSPLKSWLCVWTHFLSFPEGVSWSGSTYCALLFVHWWRLVCFHLFSHEEQGCNVLCRHTIFVSLGYIPRCGVAKPAIILCLTV